MKLVRIAFTLAALAFASPGWGQVYTKFGPATGVLKGSTSTYQTTAAASSDIIGLWSGCSGSNFLRGDGTCSVPTGTGVTSVAQTVPAGFAVTGTPVTSTGTLAISYAAGQTANLFLATPNGTTGAISERAIVGADVPPTNLATTTNGGVLSTSILAGTNGGTSNGFMSFTGPITSLKTFTLPNASATILTNNAAVTVPQGGTGLATLTANSVMLGEGTSSPNFVTMGADTVLRGTASADPVAAAVPNCGSSTNALNYNTTTHAFGCQTLSGGGTSANPSATIGLTAVNGVAATFMTSDSAPPLSQAITPTWSGQHTFSKALTTAGNTGPVGPMVFAATQTGIVFNATGQTTDSKSWDVIVLGLQMNFQAANDAGTTSSNALSFTRTSGTKTLSNIDIGNATDNPIVTVNGKNVPTVANGTIVLSGASCSTTTPGSGIASCSHTATGQYTVTFTSAFASPGPVCSANLANANGVVGTSPSTTTVILTTSSGANIAAGTTADVTNTAYVNCIK